MKRTVKQLYGELAAIYVRLWNDRADDAMEMARMLLTDDQIEVAKQEYAEEYAEQEERDSDEPDNDEPEPDMGKYGMGSVVDVMQGKSSEETKHG